MNSSEVLKTATTQGLLLVVAALILDFGATLAIFGATLLAWNGYLAFAHSMNRAILPKGSLLILLPVVLFAGSIAISQMLVLLE